MNETEFKQSLLDLEKKEHELAEERKALRSSGIMTVQNIVDRLGLNANEIRWPADSGCTILPVRKARGQVAPKYRGPNGELWTGRGRKPHWVQAILDEGKTIEDYLI